MKLNINGYAQHGKDTVADMFVEFHKLKKVAISLVIAKDIIEKGELGPYDSVEDCYQDRVNNRGYWYSFIRDKCKHDNLHYTNIAITEGDIFVGHRNQKEFQAGKSMVTATIWVDASGRGLPKEDNDSCDMSPLVKHDFYIDNSGELYETRQQVDAIMQLLNNRKKALNAY